MEQVLKKEKQIQAKPIMKWAGDVYKRQITGRGTVATGRVERGTLHLNDNLEILGVKEEVQTTVVTLSLIHIYRISSSATRNVCFRKLLMP